MREGEPLIWGPTSRDIADCERRAGGLPFDLLGKHLFQVPGGGFFALPYLETHPSQSGLDGSVGLWLASSCFPLKSSRSMLGLPTQRGGGTDPLSGPV